MYFKILAYLAETSPIASIWWLANHVSLHNQESSLSGSDSNMPSLHIPKRIISSCFASTYLLLCDSLFRTLENIRSLR
jgi:hypothetical protein